MSLRVATKVKEWILTQLIIGLNISHNPSAVLVSSQGIICAFEEEKLLQQKGYLGFPTKSLKKCLDKIEGNSSSIDVAIGFTNGFELGGTHRYLLRASKTSRVSRIKYLIFDLFRFFLPVSYDLDASLKAHVTQIIKLECPFQVRVHFVDHHLSHALSAVSMVDWDDCLVLTQDGKGDGLSGTFGISLGAGHYERVGEQSQLTSLGQLYSAVTTLLGFKPNRHEGKITGLAAFGDPKEVLRELESELIEEDKLIPLGGVEKLTDLEIYKELRRKRKVFGLTHRWLRSESNATRGYLLHSFLLKGMLENIQRRNPKPEDMAAGVQAFCEKYLNRQIQKYVEKYPKNKRICLAGGLFANVKINQKIRESFGFQDIFVQPAMDDAGTALGAACVLLKQNQEHHELCFSNGLLEKVVYLGEEYANTKDYVSLDYSLTEISDDEEMNETLAKMLTKGSIIGIFQGRSEWGPRALGNRSILATATDKSMTDKLNSKLNRSDFMPFAPMVLAEDAPKIFENMDPYPLAAKFMTITTSVRPEYRDKFPAITHVDGTARPQIIELNEAPFVAGILKAYQKLVGEGILMNTSFNLHETPIVSKPMDALSVLKNNAIDYLVIKNCIISLKD